MSQRENRAIQYLSDEQLERSSQLSIEERLRFLDHYRQLHAPRLTQNNKTKSKLIRLEVPEDLLDMFEIRCKIDGLDYQSQIKVLMREWLKSFSKE